MNDTERLDFLDSLTGRDHFGGRVRLRLSSTGRGWRLQEDERGYATVREAIDAFADPELLPYPARETPSTPARAAAFFAGVGLAILFIGLMLQGCPAASRLSSVQVLRDSCAGGLVSGLARFTHSVDAGRPPGARGSARGPLPFSRWP